MKQAILVRKADDNPAGSVLTEGLGYAGDPDNDGRRLVSPVMIGWEDEQFRIVEFLQFVAPAGKVEDGPRSRTYDQPADAVVESAPVKDAPPAAPARIGKSLVLSRLTDQQLADALSLMTARQKERWRSPDHPAVNVNDPDLVATLTAIGADLTIVLAEAG